MYSIRYSCYILMKLELSRQIFEKYPNIKFHENPFDGSRVVPCGQTGKQTDMTELIVAFRNFANPHGYTILKNTLFDGVKQHDTQQMT